MFVVAFRAWVTPLIPPETWVFRVIEAIRAWGQFLAIPLITFVLTTILYNLRAP